MEKIKLTAGRVATGTTGLALAAWRGAEATTRRLVFRLSRKVPSGMPPVWSVRMTEISVIAVVLVLFAAVFDPYFRPLSGPMPNFVLEFMRDVTDVAKSGWYIVPAIIVIAIIGLTDWSRLQRGTRRAMLTAYGRAAFILAAIAVPGIAVNIVKQVVGRARPRMAEELGVYAFSPFEFEHSFQSFPSGHAATAGSLAMILMLWHPRARWPIFAVMLLLGAARIPAGAHYPSDVAAGFAIGAIMALVLARWLARRRAVFSFDGRRTLPRLNS